MDSTALTIILSVISILLGVIGYFLKQMHSDFKKVIETLDRVNIRLVKSEEQHASNVQMSKMRFQEIERRLLIVETKIEKIVC